VVSIDVKVTLRCVTASRWGNLESAALSAAIVNFYVYRGVRIIAPSDIINIAAAKSSAAYADDTIAEDEATTLTWTFSLIIEYVPLFQLSSDAFFTWIVEATQAGIDDGGLYSALSKSLTAARSSILQPSTFADPNCISIMDPNAFIQPRLYCVRVVSATPFP
jgi:hypothetical protein